MPVPQISLITVVSLAHVPSAAPPSSYSGVQGEDAAYWLEHAAISVPVRHAW